MLRLGKIYILGDSYSTFEGCIPEGNASWYFRAPSDNTDVTDKKQTWWYKLLSSTDSELLKNNSYSGSTVCNTGYNGYTPDISFIGRFDSDVRDGSFLEATPETVLIFGGTNDSWASSPIGAPVRAAWTAEDLKSALPAFYYLLNRVKQCLPNAKTTVIINTELKNEITEGYINACNETETDYLLLLNISKQEGHPDILGMSQIFEQVYEHLKNINSLRK